MTLETPSPHFSRLLTGHFREQRGYRAWRSHGSGDWLLILTLGGHGRFGHGPHEFITRAGDAVLIRPGTPHDYGVAAQAHPRLERWELLWTHFHPRPHWLPWLDWPHIAPGLHHQHLQTPAFRDGFLQAHTLATGGHARRADLAMHALEAALLTLEPHHEGSTQDERIIKALHFLRSRIAQRTTLEDVAEHCALSVSRFAHLFKTEMGITPMVFLERERLERAKALLEWTSRSVQDVALEVGFDDAFHFSKRFRRWVGQSPKAYRDNLVRSDRH